jgi:uncharacterized membrane protein
LFTINNRIAAACGGETVRKPVFLIWTVTAIALLVLQLIALASPLDGTEGDGFFRFLGRFHPLVLHFPVAFLMLAGLLELSRFSPRTLDLSRFAGPVIVLAAALACVTVICGLLLATNEGHAGILVERHRLRGIAVAVFACVAAAAYYSGTLSQNKRLIMGYRICLVAAIGMMGLAAHDGGSLVHGPTFLADHAPGYLAPYLATNVGDDQSDANAAAEGSPLSAETLNRFQRDVGGFFGSYCVRCHGDGKQEANVLLADFDPTFRESMSRHHWNRVLGVLGSHRMPPEDAKQPGAQSRAQAIAWIQDALEEYAYVRRAERANAPLRRLNKRELNFVYQDLFGVNSNFVSSLPADPRSLHGYDTDASMLLVSMSDLRFYHDIARQAVDKYIGTTGSDRDQGVERFFVELEDVYHFGRQEGNQISRDRAAESISKDEIQRLHSKRSVSQPVYRYRKYGPLPYGLIPTGDVPGVGEGRGFARLHEQFMLLKTKLRRGQVVINVSAAMTPGKNGDPSMPRLRLEAGWRKEQSLRVSNVGEYDITARVDEPQSVEFRFRLEDVIIPEPGRIRPETGYNWLLLVLSNAARHEGGTLAGSIYGQIDTNLESSKTEGEAYVEQAASAAIYQEAGYKAWEEHGVPYLHLDALEATITPVEADPDSPWIIAPPDDNSDWAVMNRVKGVLERFLPLAFRRPVRESEIEHYLALFHKLYSAGDGFEVSLQETMAAVLISPEFLFIGYPEDGVQGEPGEIEAVRQNQYLASRLSFFLWSSIPDKRLQELAANLELTDPAVLAGEVDRMLADPKSSRMSRAFADQWLQLDKVFNVGVSNEIYPDFGAEFARLIAEETRATFDDVFRHDRDARTLYSSEHMLLNQELARHYGIDGVWGGDLRRVEVGDVSNRAGLITQASVLTMNSDGSDSHPIKRGVWLLERVLDDPPPPPPPSVPNLDTNDPLLAGLTLKEKIEHHRSLSACSGCHEKIDPWGVVFENFDATGRWRNEITDAAPPGIIDASSVLPDGTEISDFEAFVDYIPKEKESELMGSLVHHMMMYALGRELDILDEQEAESVKMTFRTSGYKLSSLIKAIVQTDAFTNRIQREAEAMIARVKHDEINSVH